MTGTVIAGLFLTVPAFATVPAPTSTNSGSHRATVATADCPEGCVAVRHYTPAQIARFRAERKARRDRIAAERAERAQLATDLAGCRTRAELAEAAARDLRLQAMRDHMARDAEEQAAIDRKRAESERLAAASTRTFAPLPIVAPRARGGGPATDWGTHFVMGVEGGVGGYTGNASNAMYAGPTWGVRAGMVSMRWLGIEGRYFGMWNDGYDLHTGSGIGYVSNELTGVLRLAIPTPYVRVYALGGIGGAWNNVTVSQNASTQSSTLVNNHRSGVVPMGGGVEVPIGRHWGLGVEGVYHYYMNQGFTSDVSTASGGQWHTNLNLHVTL